MTFFSHLYKDHDKEELIRTVDSIVSIIVQLAQLAATLYGIHWMIRHAH